MRGKSSLLEWETLLEQQASSNENGCWTGVLSPLSFFFFFQLHKLFINTTSTHCSFLGTPPMRPRRPVKPPKVAQPLWAQIFFSRSRSSQSLLSRPLARTWLYFPSFTSFCLFKNQSGILYWRGFCIMVISHSTSPSVSSPALLVRSMSAFLNTTWA